MEQYNTLFESSKIEYITPFLKLWMSFNNRIKKDHPEFTRDCDAINFYKTEWEIKKQFLRLFDLQSDDWISFCVALNNLVSNMMQYNLKYSNWDPVKYSEWMILENADRRWWKEPIYISAEKKKFQILEENKESFFSETFEIIYQVRCNLVHGSFDIENDFFIWLIKDSYNILYPILNNIFENQAAESYIYECKNTERKVDAKCEFRDWPFIVLAWSHIAKLVAPSFSQENIQKRSEQLNWKCEDKWDYLELQENIEFDSPSWASNFCLWMNSNWWNQRKTKDWKTMSDILRNN